MMQRIYPGCKVHPGGTTKVCVNSHEWNEAPILCTGIYMHAAGRQLRGQQRSNNDGRELGAQDSSALTPAEQQKLERDEGGADDVSSQ